MQQLHEVLVVEPDGAVRATLREALAGEPAQLIEVTTGAAALGAISTRQIDVALVALLLPDVAGLQLVSELRDLAPDLHIIVVSALTSEEDRLQGFAAGADDYITKPFTAADMVARLRVGLRHRGPVGDSRLEVGGLTIDLRGRQVTVDDVEVTLTRLEFDLLAHLARRPGDVCSRQDLLETVWGSSSAYQLDATVTEHVRRVRDKLADAGGDDWITTVRGAGYRFDLTPDGGAAPAHLVATAVAPNGVVELTWRPRDAATASLGPVGPCGDRAVSTSALARGVAEIATWPVARDDREYLQAALIGISTEVTESVIITSADLTVRSFNRAAEAVYGWNEDEVRGRPLLEVLPWMGTPAGLDSVAHAIRERGTWNGEVEQRRHDGTTVLMRTTATVLPDGDGGRVGLIMVNRPARPSEPPAAPDRVQVDDIAGALERDEFVPYFQPIVRLTDGAIVGVEALARWERADGTVVLPTSFLPEAERSGLIVPLGTMILEKACREAARWWATGSRVHLAANISARQLGHVTTTALVTSLLARYDIPPGALWLEVTETSLIEDLDRAAVVLGTLADAGVAFSIDDFGTGWASLTYLRRFPVRGIKIDRSFVDGLGTATSSEAIVRSIIDLGRDLSLAVVAEGVETVGQREALRALGCGLVQGYLFSKPVTADALHLLLAEQPDGAGPPRP